MAAEPDGQADRPAEPSDAGSRLLVADSSLTKNFSHMPTPELWAEWLDAIGFVVEWSFEHDEALMHMERAARYRELELRKRGDLT